MYRIDNHDFIAGIKLLDEAFGLNMECNDYDITTLVGKQNRFRFTSKRNLEIQYVDRTSFYRMLVLSIKMDLSHYEENQTERRLVYMLDCSRNAVINISSVKRMIVYLCVLGYQELSLYTEDTYEVENEPCFGYLRGRFTKKELQEIIEFADNLGLTVTLSIECLAHMRSIYRYETYYKEAFDCNDVLMVGSERVERLLENIFATLASIIPSRMVNIGMDEPFMLGRGKHLNKHGYVEPGKIFLEHLKTIVKIAEKYDFSLKMWGDWVAGKFDNCEEILAYAKEHKIKLIFWNYGGVNLGQNTTKEIQNNIEKYFLIPNKELYSDCCFCISDQKYYGIAPHNSFALHVNEAYVEAAIQQNIGELWLSSWGDCGAEVSPFACMPSIAYVGYAYIFQKKIGTFEEFFNSLYGSLEAFLKLDYANCLDNKLNLKINTSSKYFLYQDVLMGIMDKSVKKDYREYFLQHINELFVAREQVSEEYRLYFDTQIKLLEVLCIKYDIGNRTRAAYREKNQQELIVLVEVYKTLIKSIKDFFDTFRNQWYRDNKVFGFEIHEARIGALIFRITNCMERIEKYCTAEIESIPELDEDIIDLFGNGEDIIMLNWAEIISPGVMSEYFSFV